MPTRPFAPKRLLSTVGLVGLAALGPLGCPGPGNEAGEAGETCGDLLPGSLVISELVANAPGDDGGQEWIEIYNASSETVDLRGMTLVYEKVDGTGHKEHVIARSVEVPAGGYVVLGGILDEVAPTTEHIDYGYGGDLGDLGNASGYLAIVCDGLVDEIYYQDATDTASKSFDGSQVPDAIANDSLDSWCDSKTAFMDGFAATPGAANDVCAGAETCLDGNGDSIAIIHPQPGEIVITEHLPNPTGEDADKEWFELRSIAAAPFHLNGLQLGTKLDEVAEDEITAAECITINPDELVIVAQSDDPTINGNLPSEAIVWVTFEIDQTLEGALWVGVADEHLDEITWSSPDEGLARQLSPMTQDPVANDDLGNWCDADQSYGDGDLGTPGTENTACPLPPPPPGQCYEDGVLRAIVPLAPGDYEIVEVMPNPDGTDDPKEWFEVLVSGEGDLNGMWIGKEADWKEMVEADACLTVSAGQYVVFAHELDETVNGGLPHVDVQFAMALTNSNNDLILGYSADLTMPDATMPDATMPDAQASWTSVTNAKSKAKDMLGNWCDGQMLYNDVDFGSPGDPNPNCMGGMGGDMCLDLDTNLMRQFDRPIMGELILSEIMPNPSLGEPAAEWFELYAAGGFDLNGLALGKGGVVSHVITAPECLEIAADSYPVLARSNDGLSNCGLPMVAYVYDTLGLSNTDSGLQVGIDMDADGMFDTVLSEHAWANTTNGTSLSYDLDSMTWCAGSGPFGCGDAATPTLPNPPCGGGMMNGMCFDAGQNMMRPIVTPMPGDLRVNEYMANPNAVSDAAGEWFELLALAPCDLNGLDIGQAFADGPVHTITSANCIALTANETALLARNGDMMLNGGLPTVDYVYDTLNLTNSNSALHVADQGVLIDEVTWVSTGTGRSSSRDPNSNLWCIIAANVMYQFGLGDYGTPDAGNPACP